MLTSHRKEPSSILQSEIPAAESILFIFVRYNVTSSVVLKSGFVTISIRGTPALLKSINAPLLVCNNLPASSSI